MFNDLMDTIGFVTGQDPEVGQAMEKELARQRRNLELIASENIVSPAVMAAMGVVYFCVTTYLDSASAFFASPLVTWRLWHRFPPE